jgi:filamentous hemagglutinin
LQEQEVLGQKVLVPVLYLAQANDRLAPGGALIQGQNLALISGSSLSNSGTLRASQNLGASAGRIDNSGLIHAGQRLQLLASDSIHNTQGGIVKGQDVRAVALNGDIVNQRSITTQQRSGQGYSQTSSVVDSAARIEAGNNLNLSAGGDIQNIGGSLQADGDAQLAAGGNLLIVSAEEQQGMLREDKRHFWSRETITRHASDVQVGGDLEASAGNGLAVVGSSIKAEGDIALLANGNVTLAASANERSSDYRYSGKGKKVTVEKSRVSQQGALIEAGENLDIVTSHDLTLVASQLEAGSTAYFYAGNQLNLLSAQNSDYSLYDYSKKGSWGSKKTQRDEVTKVTNIGSSISTGGDLSLVSDGGQSYQKALLDSGNNLNLDSGNAISFEGVKDFKQESHESSKSDLAWNSSKGKGNTDETLRQSQLISQGEIAIRATAGLSIEIKQINRKTVSQTIDAMVKADPQLAWLKEAEARGDVDWERVQEVHDSFKYSNSGLGQGAAIALAIAITAMTSGAASAAVGSMAGATAGSGTVMAAGVAGGAAAGFGNAAATAVLTSMAATAAVSTVNNRGNLGSVVDDTFSSDSINGYATGAVVAGFTAYTNDWGRELTSDGNYRTVNIPTRVQAYAANTALKGLISGEDTSQSWLTIAGTGAMMELYQYSVGREPDIRPGVDRTGPDGAVFDETLDFVPQVIEDGIGREGKNIGFNRLCFSDFAICHGTPISDGLNQVPGLNSFATLHDSWMKGVEDMGVVQNIGTMLPALIVNYGALYDKYRILSGSIVDDLYYEN